MGVRVNDTSGSNVHEFTTGWKWESLIGPTVHFLYQNMRRKRRRRNALGRLNETVGVMCGYCNITFESRGGQEFGQ